MKHAEISKLMKRQRGYWISYRLAILSNVDPFMSFKEVLIPDSSSKLSYFTANMLALPARIGAMPMGM
jgi:hypothetical protein